MSVGSLRAEVHDTPFSLGRWKEALAGRQLLPYQEWGSWKGIIPPDCQDWAGARCLPRMWLMANSSSKEDWISRQLEAIQSKPSFTGRVSSCLLSSPPPSRAAHGLSRPEKEHTVLNCFPNWEKERQKTRLWTHSRAQGGSKKCMSLGALVTWIESNMVTSGCLGWAWALRPALSLLSQEKRPLPRCWLSWKKKGPLRTNWNLTCVQNFSSLLSQQYREAITQVLPTVCR